MKKQTAIEWFKEQIGNYYAEDAYRDMENATMYMWFEKAKEMEKEQIIDAANYGCDEWMSLEDRYRQGELYYNETYEN